MKICINFLEMEIFCKLNIIFGFFFLVDIFYLEFECDVEFLYIKFRFFLLNFVIK